VPPRTARRHRQGAASRERILDAALEIAAERGYDGATVAMVTERTGLSASSVYWHFRNKDALVAEALEHSYRQWRERTPPRAADPGEDDLEAQLRRHFRQVREGLEEQPEFWRLGLLMGLLRAEPEPVARTRFLQVRAETLDDLEGWLSALLPARRRQWSGPLTRLLLAAGDGLFVAAQTDQDWDFGAVTEALGPGFARVLADPPRAPRGRPPARRSASNEAPAEDADSRLRLIAAAADVAAERGYVGTTISQVCERSGLPPSSLYWFFEDKDALLAAVVDHSFTAWQGHQAVWDPQSGADRRAEVLTQVLRRSLRSFTDAPDFLRIGLMVSLARQEEEPAARAHFLRIRRDVEAELTRWFASTLPGSRTRRARAEVLARVVIAVTDGLFLAEQMDRPLTVRENDPDALAAGLVALLEAVAAG
jgi:AcrR family transcriptional regulator